MEGPDVPRSRDRAGTDGKRHKRFGSTLTSFIKYPHQANGKRELKAMSSHPNDLHERPPTSTSTTTSTTRDHPTPTSVDTAVRIPTGYPQTHAHAHAHAHSSSSEALGEPLVQDFQDRYTTRSSYPEHDERDFAQSKPMSSPDSAQPTSPDFSDFDDGRGQQEYSRRGIHVPTRTSSNQRAQSRPRQRKQSFSGTASEPTTPEATPARMYVTDRSSADSVFSQETTATSIHTLPPLQSKGPDNSDAQQLEPVIEDDPRSFDLVAPPQESHHVGLYAMERRSEQLFSTDHLQEIFEDPKLLLKFTGFLNSHRPQSIPILIYYLDALKALRAIRYANAIAEALGPIKGHSFTNEVAKPTGNSMLEEKANETFAVLAREDLAAYIAHTWIQVVSASIQRRITGTLAPHLREASEGLAEVFCLTDPSRPDNPIVFASEEFARTTQYGMGYTIGRNCRFLQGPRTNRHSVRRLAEACAAGKEHSEVFLNYRRDGSPFMNLLLIAPLMDSRGNTRYFIGAQVDVSGLIKDCSDLDGLARLAEKEADPEAAAEEEQINKKDEFQDLSEMFNGAELETVRRCGGRMHKEYADESDTESLNPARPRLLLTDPTQDLLDTQERAREGSIRSVRSAIQKEKLNGRLEGVYQHYLLVRPAPSLRILFTSPSLRVPGILQSPFLDRIGGSARVRSDLATALGEGRGVTAKIRWLTKADSTGEGEGRPRWIHCTPLIGHAGAVGVWMIVLVDEEGATGATGRRFRAAPPVANVIGGKEWDHAAQSAPQRSRERRLVNGYDKEQERRGGAGTTAASRDNNFSASATRNARRPSTGRKNSYGQSRTPKRNGGGGAESLADASEFSFSIKTPLDGPKRPMVY